MGKKARAVPSISRSNASKFCAEHCEDITVYSCPLCDERNSVRIYDVHCADGCGRIVAKVKADDGSAYRGDDYYNVLCAADQLRRGEEKRRKLVATPKKVPFVRRMVQFFHQEVMR